MFPWETCVSKHVAGLGLTDQVNNRQGHHTMLAPKGSWIGPVYKPPFPSADHKVACLHHL